MRECLSGVAYATPGRMITQTCNTIVHVTRQSGGTNYSFRTVYALSKGQLIGPDAPIAARVGGFGGSIFSPKRT